MTDNLPLDALFIIQIIASFLIILVSLFVLSLFLFSIGIFWLTFLYLLSFLFAFGGCWFCKFYAKCNCEHLECCEDHKDACFNHKLLYKIFGKEKLKQFLLSNK